MLVLILTLLLAVTSVRAQECTADFPNFFDFGAAAGDSPVPETGIHSEPLSSPIPIFGLTGTSYVVSIDFCQTIKRHDVTNGARVYNRLLCV